MGELPDQAPRRRLAWKKHQKTGGPLTAVIVVAIALLLGAGLVISQLVRLRTWLGKPPPDAPPDSGEE
jgi:hypothetical protein